MFRSSQMHVAYILWGKCYWCANNTENIQWAWFQAHRC